MQRKENIDFDFDIDKNNNWRTVLPPVAGPPKLCPGLLLFLVACSRNRWRCKRAPLNAPLVVVVPFWGSSNI